MVLEGRGDIEGARSAYETAIVRSPKHYQAQFNLARLEGAQGNGARERELLAQAIESRPDFAIGHFFLGKALMADDQLERAEEVTRTGLELTNENPLGWAVLADILNRTGERAEADRALARVRELQAAKSGG